LEGECFAIEVDFFRADRLANMSEEDVVDLTLRAISASLSLSSPLEKERNDMMIDVSVVRARNAVSHFCVGSASASPSGTRLRHGIYICGDWIDRTGHASWSTEKAVVTGKQAAIAFAQDFNLAQSEATRFPIIPAASDSPQLKALRQVASTLRNLLPKGMNAIPLAPWVLLKQLCGR
jgi:uncharacterized protein with NAD-binding domain and iron-sulfur cluster